MERDQREMEMRRRREEQRRRARQDSSVKAKKKRKKRGGMMLFMASLLLLGVVLISVFTFLFPVKTITVQGNERYTAKEIIAASGIEQGDNILALGSKGIQSKIRAGCPYVYEVTLQRKLPTAVIITVVEKGPTLSFPSGKHYILATDRYELIEAKATEPQGVCVYGVSVTAAGVGEELTITDQTQKEALDTLLKEFAAQSLEGITQIDLRDLENIRIMYQDRHVWELGNINNLGYKLQFGMAISKDESVSGTLDLSGLVTGDKGGFLPGVIQDFSQSNVTQTDVSEK